MFYFSGILLAYLIMKELKKQEGKLNWGMFYFSGILLAYLIMKELKKEEGKLNWGMFYIHRFWR
jgi:hypothetical protein